MLTPATNIRLLPLCRPLPWLLLTWLFLSVNVAAAQDVTIHYHERPPYYVTDGNGFTGIIGERVSAVFKEANIPYTVQKTPAKRQLFMLKGNTGADCMVGWFLIPRRKEFARYSKAIYQDRPMVALTLESNPAFNQPYSLEDLIGSQDLRMLKKDGYSYGLVIDFMLDHQRPRTLSTTAESTNMILMIHEGRADYMLIGVEEVEHLIKLSGLPRNDFKVIFPGGMPPFNKRYLLFSKQTDPAIIDRINRAIDRLYPID